MGVKDELLNKLSLLFTFETLKIIGIIHNTSGGIYFNLYVRSGPEVTKTFFMLNSIKHEILNAHK